jgi:hypothetical protein
MLAAGVVVAAAVTAITTTVPAAMASGTNATRATVAPATGSTLSGGSTLQAGQSIWSSNGSYELLMQTNGNLVEYGPSGAIWATGTPSSGAYAAMQTDGNFVVYTSGGAPLWQSGTGGSSGSFVLTVETNGYLVITDNGNATWSTHSSLSAGSPDSTLGSGQSIWSPNGKYELLMQTDGNLVEYGPSGAVWATGTPSSAKEAVMQTDGNFVVYAGGGVTALWQSGTGGNSGTFTLNVENNGNIAIFIGHGGTLWARQGLGAAPTAIAWAQKYLGTSTDDGECLQFVYSAYSAAGVNIGTVGSSNGAAQYWSTNPAGYIKHSGNMAPPAGALVFWGATSANLYGHVGIYVGWVSGSGNDEVISTASWPESGSDVHYFSLSGRNAAGYPYLGWMGPASIGS